MPLRMRPTRVIFILFAALACGLIAGCEMSSTAPSSQYPADIIGHVIVAKQVTTKGIVQKPLGNNSAFWIVDVSVNNKEYQYPVSSERDSLVPLPTGIGDNMVWSIVVNGEPYAGLNLTFNAVYRTPPSPVIIQKGQSGKMILPFEVSNINPTNAQICFMGQEPYSYGKLVAGDEVATYDWDLKKIAQVSEVPHTTNIAANIATVKRIWCGGFSGTLNVDLIPTKFVVANKNYTVEL